MSTSQANRCPPVMDADVLSPFRRDRFTMNVRKTFGILTAVAILTSTHAEGGKRRAVRHLPPAPSDPVIVRINTAAGGGEANGDSEWTAISADGRFTAFGSAASLVDADTDRGYDVYLYDRTARTITLVTPPDVADAVRPSISGDGTVVAYAGGPSQRRNVYLYDSASAKTTNISAMRQPFFSDQVPRLSGSGDIVAFESLEGSAFVIRVHDRSTGLTVAHPSLGFAITPTVSLDGNVVACVSAMFGGADIVVLDRLSGRVERASVASNEVPGNGNSTRSTISGDGRFVAFDSSATNLVERDTNGKNDVFVRDRLTRMTSVVSVGTDGELGNGNSHRPAISARGRYVAFQSDSTNLVSADTNGKFDIFIHDRLTGTTRRVSVAADGTEGNGHSPQFREDPVGAGPSLSGDGRFVVFRSEADNLVPGDTNRAADVFLVATELPADE